MYGIFTYIYHKNQLDVGEYSIKCGSYGLKKPLMDPVGNILKAVDKVFLQSLIYVDVFKSTANFWRVPSNHQNPAGVPMDVIVTS